MLTLVALMLTTAEAKDLSGVKGWHVSRTIQINAAPEYAYHYASDFNTWPSWTAWNAELDPAATWSYTGTPGTVGHSSTWTGPEMGDGTMTITAATDNAAVEYDLFFDNKPKANPGQILLSSDGTVTTVTWENAGKMGAIGRALFGKKIEAMIAADFDEGLANLKALAEKDAAEAARAAAVAAAKAKAAELESAAATAEGAAASAKAAADAAKTAADTATAAVATAKKKEKAAAQTAADAATKAAADAKTAADAAAAKAAEARKAADEAKAAAAKLESGS